MMAWGSNIGAGLIVGGIEVVAGTGRSIEAADWLASTDGGTEGWGMPGWQAVKTMIKAESKELRIANRFLPALML